MHLPKTIAILFISTIFNLSVNAQKIKVNYVKAFENINHPQVAYWFFTGSMMDEKRYKAKIDSFVQFSKYTLVFLTDRGSGSDFYDAPKMHPIFQKLVAYAHQKGLQIGLQIWKSDNGTLLENTDRLIQEGEVTLDANGTANYSVKAKGARQMNHIIKSELFKIYAFKKTADGFYDPATLQEISGSAKVDTSIDKVNVAINAGKDKSGYTAYILTQHYYNSCSNFSAQAKSLILDAFKAYADISFDGIGLDEYKNMTIAREPILIATKDAFWERVYSVGMAKKIKSMGMDLDKILFDMRFAPTGNPAIRIKAINTYISVFRTATLDIEAAMYDLGKSMYGKNAFIGLHNTFHNNLDRDEVWQTGVTWWSIKRDYGHTDENTPTSIQMGIGMAYKQNAMYNMYYDKTVDAIWTKALYDLRFGVRTHYHAANDVQGWGVSIDNPIALEKINKVENGARLLNRFNPPFPNIKLLVVYGMEALFNWYPDYGQRGLYDINDKLGMDKKSMELWNNGYLNASVPTDVIADGRLKLNKEGKPTLNGHVFDAIVLLNPQYAKESTTNFFQNYVNKGGKLLVEGDANYDFNGKDISGAWQNIIKKSVANSYSIENVAKLGVPKNELVDGVENETGSYTFTNAESLKTDQPALFSFTYKGNTFSGSYKGLAAIKVDTNGNLEKLAATGFSNFKKNGKTTISLSAQANVFAEIKNGILDITIADETKSITCKKL